MDQSTKKAALAIGNEVSGNTDENGKVEQIFGNPLIFEKILKYLIFDKDVNASKKMMKTVRLVQKHWLETTSTLLKKSKIPIIVVQLNGDKVNLKKKIEELHEFVDTLTSPDKLAISLLPFKLGLPAKYFQEENYQYLHNCLTLLGNELLELQISFPRDGETMPLSFPQFNLPLLRKIAFEFSFEVSREHGLNFSVMNENGLLLLQQILNSSENLQEFVFPDSYYVHLSLPKNFENLQLPNTILSVGIQGTLKMEYLEVLLNNKLPNLKHLVLRLPKTPYENTILFRVLERFSHLTSLKLDGKLHRPSEDTLLKFPKLEKLGRLQIYGSDYELDPEITSDLQKLLPNIRSLELNCQTETSLEKWIRSSKFQYVEFLSLSDVVDGKICDLDLFKSPSLDTFAKMHTAFPNVTTLAIPVNAKNMTGLMNMFHNMTQLKSLRLDGREYTLEGAKWKCESCLVGLPAWLISVHADESDYLQSFIDKRGRKPCLLNLIELERFTLCVQTSEYFMPPKSRNVTIFDLSDVLFSQIFLRMPKLRIITFSENLQPTENMKAKFIGQGRRIEYISVED